MIPTQDTLPSEKTKRIGQLRLSIFNFTTNTLIHRLANEFQTHGIVQVKAEIPLKLFCFWRPAHIHRLYTQKSTAIYKPPHNMMEREEWLMGGQLVSDTGEHWKRKKNMYNPLFT